MSTVDEQLPMFDVTDYRVASAGRPPRRGKPGYRRITNTGSRLPCDDCILVLRNGAWVGPAPLRAVWVRHDLDGTVFLCHPHAQDWMLMEARAEQQK